MHFSAREHTLEERLEWVVEITEKLLASPNADISYCAGLVAAIKALTGDRTWLEEAVKLSEQSQTESDESTQEC